MKALEFTPDFIAGLEARGYHEITLHDHNRRLTAVVKECGCCHLEVCLRHDSGNAYTTLNFNPDNDYEFQDLAEVLYWEDWRLPEQEAPLQQFSTLKMRTEITNLSTLLEIRLAPVLEEAERAGCSFVSVYLETDVGFTARIECPGEEVWVFQAHEFSYLLGHMKQHIETLTP